MQSLGCLHVARAVRETIMLSLMPGEGAEAASWAQVKDQGAGQEREDAYGTEQLLSHKGFRCGRKDLLVEITGGRYQFHKRCAGNAQSTSSGGKGFL